MKYFFPLPLKVSLWLLLNLVLLAVVGGVFLVQESGFGWDAFVTGSAGSGLQTAANLIATELQADPTHPDEVLTRFMDEYKVDFALYQITAGPRTAGVPVQVAGPAMNLPVPVRERLIAEERTRPLSDGRPPGQNGLPFVQLDLTSLKLLPNLTDTEVAEITPLITDINKASVKVAEAQARSTMTRRTGLNNIGRLLTESQLPQFATYRSENGSPAGGEGEAAATASSRRFLVRLTAPAVAYYAGVQLPRLPGPALFGAFPGFAYNPNLPTTLIMRTNSLGQGGLLFNLSPWLIAAAAVVGLSVLFWLPLVLGITRSLSQLTRATEQIAQGRFDTCVDESRRDEIGRLGGAVNVMAAQLDRAATGQKRFLGDIAHELGSPVGRMQVAVGILEERAEPELQPAVADVREEVQQMSGLVGELLAFTKAGLRAREAALARVELVPLAAEVLDREAAQGRISVNIPDGLAVLADTALLTRAIGNLVRNALRYAGDAGPITLLAQTDGQEVVIAVEDSGTGVPADTLARLGEPFYRPEFARTRETGGVGLGLAIVKSAAEACRGSVRFSNREPHGFRAEVRLGAA